MGQIILGDCLEVMRSFPNDMVDSIITDAPFGIGKKYENKKEVASTPQEYWEWLGPRYQEMLRVLKPGGFFAMWQNQQYWPYFNEWFGSEEPHIFVAAKGFVQIRPTPMNFAWDPVITFWKPGPSGPLYPGRGKQELSRDFHVSGPEFGKNHPAQIHKEHPFPRPLSTTRYLISNFTKPNGLVLDPFIGSGTTAVAAYLEQRDCIGIEIEPKYVELCERRLEKVHNECV